jgi:hypothetical protein
VVFGLGQQLDAMALERGDDLCPHLAAHMPVAQFFGDMLLTTDLEALHGSLRDASGLGAKAGTRPTGQTTSCARCLHCSHRALIAAASALHVSRHPVL